MSFSACLDEFLGPRYICFKSIDAVETWSPNSMRVIYLINGHYDMLPTQYSDDCSKKEEAVFVPMLDPQKPHQY